MQTLMIFWSSWHLEIVVSERQEGPPKLSFARPEQSRTNQIVDQKITLTHTLPVMSKFEAKRFIYKLK